MSQTLKSEYKKKFTRIRWEYGTEQEKGFVDNFDQTKREGGGTGSPVSLSPIPPFIPALLTCGSHSLVYLPRDLNGVGPTLCDS
jgi:hypothetical protein